MKKKVNISARPQAAAPSASAGGELKMFCVKIPEDEHTMFKMLCAKHRTTMAAEVNAFIRRRIVEME